MKDLFITVLLLALGYVLYDSMRKTSEIDLMQTERKRLDAELDSITVLQRKAEAHYRTAATDLNVIKRQIIEQQILTHTYRVKYEAALHRPVPRLSDAQIDSALSALYPR